MREAREEGRKKGKRNEFNKFLTFNPNMAAAKVLISFSFEIEPILFLTPDPTLDPGINLIPDPGPVPVLIVECLFIFEISKGDPMMGNFLFPSSLPL